jgi:hypothetical protein
VRGYRANWVAALALIAMASACTSHRPRAIVADAPLQVLEHPSPLDYPSTSPLPNRVLATVPAGGRLLVVGSGYQKDYIYYQVKLADGRKGFVIRGVSPFHEEAPP